MSKSIPEPSFDRVSAQERERSRRLARILAVMLGPSLALGLLGFVDAAGVALVASIAASLLLVMVFPQAEDIDRTIPGLTGNQDLWLAALLIVFYFILPI